MEDVRWIQRLNSFSKALRKLTDAVHLSEQRELSELEKQGMIQTFEFTHELSWKMLKDFLEEKGNKGLYGSKDVIRLSFQLGLIENGEIWMNMIKSRNQTSHTYDEEVSNKIIELIISDYYDAFKNLESFFLSQINREVD
ncbi:MAG: nucleotidyltransferase substrate binding protein [Thermotogota bacterium]|nr:nucleotidyltransferase substrate binding protein [Thermotogota bacterium]